MTEHVLGQAKVTEKALGVQPGDRVAAYLPNVPQAAVAEEALTPFVPDPAAPPGTGPAHAAPV